MMTINNDYLLQYKHRCVRDLAWVIASPSLISGQYDDVNWWDDEHNQYELQSCATTLAELDKDPTPLLNHLNSLKSRRLGLLFEKFVEYWLLISPNYQLIAKNKQLQADGRTFGEIDFIIENKQNELIHLEVAVKFYLGNPPLKDDFQWFGRNTDDQLGKKFNHLRSHQTQLSEKFKTLFPYEIQHKACVMKGRLFYPQNTTLIQQPSLSANQHLQGFWSRDWHFFEQASCIEIDKHQWLSPLTASDIHDLIKQQRQFNKPNGVHCFVFANQKDSDPNNDNQLIETQRGFYLPYNFIFPS